MVERMSYIRIRLIRDSCCQTNVKTQIIPSRDLRLVRKVTRTTSHWNRPAACPAQYSNVLLTRNKPLLSG